MTIEERNEIIRQFCLFNQDKWLFWIDGLFNKNPQKPILSFRDADTVNSLFWIYNNLSDIKSQKEHNSLLGFNKALVFYLSELTSIEENAEIIFSIIYYIDNTRIYGCRLQIERIIISEKLYDLYFGTTNLHFYLIKAYTNIDNSESIKDYLDVKLRSVSDSYFFYVFLNYYFARIGFEEGMQKLSTSLNDLSEESLVNAMTAVKEFLYETKKIEPFFHWYSKELQSINDKNPLVLYKESMNSFFTDEDFFTNEFFRNNNYYVGLVEMIRSNIALKIIKKNELKTNMGFIKNSIDNPNLKFKYLSSEYDFLQKEIFDYNRLDTYIDIIKKGAAIKD